VVEPLQRGCFLRSGASRAGRELMTEARPCERAPPAIARCAEPSSDQKTIEVLDELAIEYERRADRREGQGSFGDPKSWRAKL
jgi:hypothetical protein